MFTENANKIFNRVIDDYHRFDDVDHKFENPYPAIITQVFCIFAD